jgi:hypothetical protein
MAERIRIRQDLSADFPQKEHAGIRGDSVQWQRPGQAIPPCNKRIECPTDGCLPHPRAIEMGGPLVIGHDGRRGRRFPISWARDRCSPNSAMRNGGKPDGSYRWLDRATG